MRRLTRSTPRTLALCVVVMGASVLVTLALGDAFDNNAEDRTITPIAIGTNPASSDTTRSERPDIVVDDGIPTGDARRAATAAENRFDGAALTVDRDDGRYEIELQRPNGTIVEVLVDSRFKALGIDTDS